MATRTIKFEGRNITVPADATDDEVAQIIESSAPKSPSKPTTVATVPTKTATPLDQMRAASRGDKTATVSDILKGVVGSAATLGNQIPGVSQLGDVIYGEKGKTEGALKQLESENQNKTGYQGGKILADIGLTMAPGMGAYKATSAAINAIPQIGKVSKYVFPKAAEVIGQGAAGATGSYLTGADPTEGALLGAGLATAAYPAGLAYRTGKRVLAKPEIHASRHLDKAIKATDSGRQYVIDTLRNTKGMVPGETATAGIAAVGSPGGKSLPWLKSLEEAARGRPSAGKFVDIDRANEAARRAVLEPTEQLGKDMYDEATGTVMQSPYKQIRENVTRPIYNQANSDMVYVPPRLNNMLGAPEAQVSALRGRNSYSQAGANARAAGEAAPPAAIPMQEMGGHVPMGPMGATPYEAPWTQLPMRSIDDLQRAKNYLTKEIDTLSNASDSAGLLRAQQLRDARRQLTDAMRSQSPAYDQANKLFAEFSAPQNQSEIYQQLATALRKPGMSGERASTFMNAMENAPRTLKRAGLPRYNFLEQVLTPQQTSEVKSLADSLRRNAEYDALPGSKNVLPPFISPAEQVESASPPLLARWMTILRHGLKKVAGHSDEQVAAIIDEAMTDPNKLADLIEQLPPEVQRQVKGRLGTVGGLLAPQDNQGE